MSTSSQPATVGTAASARPASATVRLRYTPEARRYSEFTWFTDTTTGISHIAPRPDSPVCGASIDDHLISEPDSSKPPRCLNCRHLLIKAHFPDDRWALENWWYNWNGYICHVMLQDRPLCNGGTKRAYWLEISLLTRQAHCGHCLRRLRAKQP